MNYVLFFKSRNIASFPITDGGGFTASNHLDANITPSALALNLYFKTHSVGTTPSEFWGRSLKPRNVSDDPKDIDDKIQDSWNEVMGSSES